MTIDWSSEEIITFLRSRWYSGASAREIAGELGVSRNAVIGKVHRLKLARRKSTQARVAPLRPARPVQAIVHVAPKVNRAALAAAARARNEARKRLAELEAERVRLPDDSFPPLHIDEGPKPETFLGKTLLELEFGECRYPRGGDDDEPITFCAQPVSDGYSYCAEHCAVCFAPPPIRKRNDPAPAKYGHKQPATQLRAFGV